MNAFNRISSIFGFREFATHGANKNVFRMPGVACQEIPGEEVNVLTAGPALADFDVKEILGLCFLRPADPTFGAVQVPDLGAERRQKRIGHLPIGGKINRLYFFLDDPIGHRVDIEADDAAPYPISFQKGRASAHERISDTQAAQSIGFVKGYSQRFPNELGQDQTSEEGSWSPGKPLMHGNDRTIVLLDLLFSQREISNERNIEVFFDHEGL
jgi:hypothetical protein